jgi:DNA-binding GntR family transcriptional regulator
MNRHRGWLPYSETKAQSLANMFTDLIRGGVLVKGDMLPHTKQLVSEHKVSSQTTTRIRKILAERDLVRIIKGRGTFVK